jgi:predicted metal-dependent HD superfamily phosphohydrolase
MRKIDATAVREVKQHVSELLKKELPMELVYHTIDHTRRVVKNAEKIGSMENFSEDELSILLIAAWFHDVGYTSQYKGHEEISVQMANNFLSAQKIDHEAIRLVLDAIRATEFPQKPVDKIGAALCDADFMHLADRRYFDISEPLRQEWKITGVNPLNKLDFAEVSLDIFRKHSYHTTYCQEHCAKLKEKNLELLKKVILRRQKKKKPVSDPTATKSKISTGYSRGVDSMFRMTARNQINLSSIADNKSNILISLNGIIISLGIAFLIRKFEETPEIIFPTIVFLVFSLTTIVLAILSTRPHISGGKFTKEDIEQMKVNLLFFGSFYNMEVEDYEWAIKEMIDNDKYLYSTMIKDQFYLGKVLARKYKLLRAAYFVFMFGLIISVGIFILVFIHL